MVANFVFEYAVTYNITLNVTDGNGNWNTDHFIITVWDITKPKAEAGTDAVIDQHDGINFSGNKSIDDKGIVNYTWSFVYDGRTKRFYGVEMSFVFDISGTYNVNLKVFDENGNWDTDQLIVTVRDITPPEAHAGEDQEIKQGTEITLDGIASIDNVGIVNYTWSFEYNGSAVSLYGPTVIFRFDTPENYTVTLTVADAMDNRDTDTANILVVPREKPNVTDDDLEDDDVIPADDDENESRIESWLRRSHLSFPILATILIALLFLSIVLYFILRKTRKQAELEEAERREEEDEEYYEEDEIEEPRRRSLAKQRKRTIPRKGKRDGRQRGERRAGKEIEDTGDGDDWIVFEETPEEKEDAEREKRRPKGRRKPKRKQERRRRYEESWDDDEAEEEYIVDFDDDEDDHDLGKDDEEWDEDVQEEDYDDDMAEESHEADPEEETKDEWDSFWDDVDEEETPPNRSKGSAAFEKKTVLKKKKKKKKTIKKHGSRRKSSRAARGADTSDDDDMWVS